MSFSSMQYPDDKQARYTLMLSQAKALIKGETHPLCAMANISALLYQGMPDINWCGFYLLDAGKLTLGPFCGLPACIRIPLGRGVCGTAASTGDIQRVADVHAFPGHIACDSASNSEIVLPICHEGRVVAVLDIDSPSLSRFDDTDEANLVALVALLESECDFTHAGYDLK